LDVIVVEQLICNIAPANIALLLKIINVFLGYLIIFKSWILFQNIVNAISWYVQIFVLLKTPLDVLKFTFLSPLHFIWYLISFFLFFIENLFVSEIEKVYWIKMEVVNIWFVWVKVQILVCSKSIHWFLFYQFQYLRIFSIIYFWKNSIFWVFKITQLII